MVAAIVISKDVGGNLSEVLERLASTLRSKAALEGKIRALITRQAPRRHRWTVTCVSCLCVVSNGARSHGATLHHLLRLGRDGSRGGVVDFGWGVHRKSSPSTCKAHSMLATISSIALALSILAALYAVYSLFRSAPDEDRTYKDKPPLLFRMLWPLIRLMSVSLNWSLTEANRERYAMLCAEQDRC